MKTNQILSSGLLIRQDFGESVRAVFFQTDFEEFLYATHGGTLFLVNFRGRTYGVTCKHVLGDFEARSLFITQQKHAVQGSLPAPIEGLWCAASPTGEAEGTDVIDICVFEFTDDIDPSFFGGSAYIIDEQTIGTSQAGHRLRVVGVLKDKSEIISPDITMGFCNLEFTDAGPSFSDPFLRQGKAEFSNPAFDNIVGLSGSPVFDETTNRLCGMVNRGGMSGRDCTIHYIDIFDIALFLAGVRDGAAKAAYTKVVVRKQIGA